MIDESRALKHLIDLLKIEGLSGREGRVAAAVRAKLLEAGCRPGWIRTDAVHRKLPEEGDTGNLILKLPGTGRSPPRLLMAHLDTVPLCRDAVPVLKGRRIVPRGATALGGDNRTAVAALVNVVETILRHDLSHPPLTFLFTVAEEIGLLGARHVALSDLGRPRMGFNVDGGVPHELVVGATGAERWVAEITGRSAHAGLHPEEGVSAALIAAHAIAQVSAAGYFGKIVKGRRRGTSNVGVIQGGEVTNQVTDFVRVQGESRSHDKRFLSQITRAYRRAFEGAARAVKNREGRTGRVRFRAHPDYQAFRLSGRSPVVTYTSKAMTDLGLAPRLRVVDGGLDANYLNARGVPTVTLGAGQHGAHTVDEYVDLDEYLTGCRILLALATRS